VFPFFFFFLLVRQTAKNNRKLLNLIFILDVFQFHQLECEPAFAHSATHFRVDAAQLCFAKLLSLAAALRIRNIC